MNTNTEMPVSTHERTSNNSSDEVLNCDTALWIQLLPEHEQRKLLDRSNTNNSSIDRLSQSLKSWTFNEWKPTNDAVTAEEISCGSSLTKMKSEDFIDQEEIMIADLLEEVLLSMGMTNAGNSFHNSCSSIASIDSVALTMKRFSAEQSSAGATVA